jgi:hypothetical protein
MLNLRGKKVRRWLQKVVDRERWGSVGVEAMALRGPQDKSVSAYVSKYYTIIYAVVSSKYFT